MLHSVPAWQDWTKWGGGGGGGWGVGGSHHPGELQIHIIIKSRKLWKPLGRGLQLNIAGSKSVLIGAYYNHMNQIKQVLKSWSNIWP